jgi:hypothetical protein
LGYDLHITRAESWAENANHLISPAEWLAYVEADLELELSPEDGPCFTRWSGKSKHPDPWLDWSHGNIYSKNPDDASIDNTVAIARELDAQIQGDDGEVYCSGHEPPVSPVPSTLDRLRNWLQALRLSPIKQITPPFKVGERVLDVCRRETTVIEIDPKANHNLGRVRVRYDHGREAATMLAGSGLIPLPGSNGDENRSTDEE